MMLKLKIGEQQVSEVWVLAQDRYIQVSTQLYNDRRLCLKKTPAAAFA